jgi:hypothetical protein
VRRRRLPSAPCFSRNRPGSPLILPPRSQPGPCTPPTRRGSAPSAYIARCTKPQCGCRAVRRKVGGREGQGVGGARGKKNCCRGTRIRRSSPQPSRLRGLGHDGVGDGADPVHLARHDIAVLQEQGWLAEAAHAGRGARQDNVTGGQGDEPGEVHASKHAAAAAAAAAGKHRAEQRAPPRSSPCSHVQAEGRTRPSDAAGSQTARSKQRAAGSQAVNSVDGGGSMHAPRHPRHDVLGLEHHLGGGGVLHHHAVQGAANALGVHVGDFVGGHDGGADGRVAVQALACTGAVARGKGGGGRRAGTRAGAGQGRGRDKGRGRGVGRGGADTGQGQGQGQGRGRGKGRGRGRRGDGLVLVRKRWRGASAGARAAPHGASTSTQPQNSCSGTYPAATARRSSSAANPGR